MLRYVKSYEVHISLIFCLEL